MRTLRWSALAALALAFLATFGTQARAATTAVYPPMAPCSIGFSFQYPGDDTIGPYEACDIGGVSEINDGVVCPDGTVFTIELWGCTVVSESPNGDASQVDDGGHQPGGGSPECGGVGGIFLLQIYDDAGNRIDSDCFETTLFSPSEPVPYGSSKWCPAGENLYAIQRDGEQVVQCGVNAAGQAPEATQPTAGTDNGNATDDGSTATSAETAANASDAGNDTAITGNVQVTTLPVTGYFTPPPSNIGWWMEMAAKAAIIVALIGLLIFCLGFRGDAEADSQGLSQQKL